jgi:hypothetical protein
MILKSRTYSCLTFLQKLEKFSAKKGISGLTLAYKQELAIYSQFLLSNSSDIRKLAGVIVIITFL